MTISLRPRGPFALDAPLAMALTDDGGEVVSFRAALAADGSVDVDFRSDLPPERVEAHVARVLSLDVDASGLAAVAGRDPAPAVEGGGGLRRFPRIAVGPRHVDAPVLRAQPRAETFLVAAERGVKAVALERHKPAQGFFRHAQRRVESLEQMFLEATGGETVD